MTALHRVKAYFGMVPADELDSYDGYGPYADADRPVRGGDRYDADRHDLDRYDVDRYDADRYGRRPRQDRYDADRYDADRYGAERYDADRYGADRYEGDRYGADRYASERYGEGRYDDDRLDAARHDRAGRGDERSRTPRPRDPEPEPRAELPRLGADHDRTGSGDRDEEADVSARSNTRGRSWEHNTGPNHTSRSTRSATLASVGSSTSSGSVSASGALALDEPVRRSAERPESAAATDTPPVPEITTLQPTSYNEARVIGERYRDGIPVIMNLTEMDDAAAKRLVDFAAGLAFALRGSIEKVTSRVFLLSPPNVEVSASDRRKLAETSFASAP